jgi:hemolysin activation/secretion protein
MRTGRILLFKSLCSLMVVASSCHAETVELHNNSILSQDEINNVLSPYQNSDVQAEDLAAIINSFNNLYRSKGYINSGVVFPSQQKGQVIRLEAIEGTLQGLNITNAGGLRERRISSVLESEVDGPLNLADLDIAFDRLERDPNIQAIKGTLRPGILPGEATLDLEVLETEPLTVVLAGNNYRSTSVGSEQVQVEVRHTNLTGNSDILEVGLNHADGLDSARLSYSFPLDAKTRLMAYYSQGDTLVVEKPFASIDIESEIDTTGIAAQLAFWDTSASTFSVGLGFETKASNTSLLGLPFDFSQGSVEGETKASVLIASVEYQQRTLSQALSGRIIFRKGLETLDATILPGGVADGEFELWQVQMSYVRRLSESRGWTLTSSFSAQITSDTLQSFERYALGGHSSIRGFRENQVLRDKAWQWRTTVNFPVIAADSSKFGVLDLYPFFDFGVGKNVEFDANVRQEVELSSVGLGLSYRYLGLRLNVEFASRLDEKREQGSSLQDNGVHVGVSYEF